MANFSPVGNMAGEYATNVVTPTKGQGNDATLRWTSFDGTAWSPVALLSDHESSHGPAAAMFSVFGTENLYCAHRNNANADVLYTTWATDTQIPGRTTAEGPALAVYRDKLYCVRRSSTDASVWFTSFDGMSWSKDASIPGWEAAAGPALAVYKDKLYCVYRGTDEGLRYLTFNGTSWSAPTTITNATTTANPALAVYHDRLYCVHRK